MEVPQYSRTSPPVLSLSPDYSVAHWFKGWPTKLAAQV